MNQGLNYEILAVMPEAFNTGLFSSLCTIQAPNVTRDGYGQPDTADWSNVAGLSNIACRFAPPSQARVINAEQKVEMDTKGTNIQHCLLDGYFPSIIANALGPAQRWRAIIDGNAYQIWGADKDGSNVQTRLSLMRIEL